jgi:uncharacterized damage-inducible protein DinB
MKAFFKDKFEYNYESNKCVITLIEANPHAYSERVQKLICHTLNVQNIWTTRILRKPNSQGVWDVFNLNELQQLNLENHNLSLQMLAECTLYETMEYINTIGETFSNKVEDMVYHIINHGTYHRGQIITDLKSEGITPIPTDYIFFRR